MTSVAVIKDNNSWYIWNWNLLQIYSGENQAPMPSQETSTLLSAGTLCWSATLFEGLHLQFFNSKLLATYKSIQRLTIQFRMN